MRVWIVVTIVDTNVILRHLTQDNVDQSTCVRPIFAQFETGQRFARLPEAVLVETVQVLESARLYNTPRESIRTRLSALIRMPGIRVPSKKLYLRALDVYAACAGLSFVDALCVAYAEREHDPVVLTFDRGFDRVVNLSREEPAPA